MNFKEIGLNKKILKAILGLGFEIPTPIQEKVIPQILNTERDIVGLAQTGTGKTAAFGLPILQKLDIKGKNIQALILCPTRELCLQITGDMESYSEHIPELSITPVYGGAGIVMQMQSVRKGTHIIVATPGRLLDLINRKVVQLGSIKYLVLDEADTMLNMGFKEDLDAILDTIPKKTQTLLFSATMPRDVEKIASNYMKDPVEFIIGQKNSGTANVEHKYYTVRAKDKFLALKRIVDFNPKIYGIIFCRTRISTQEVADQMIKEGYNAEALHGDLSQVQREYVMRKFRDKSLQLLVATDIAARGLDVNDLTHVIHYDLPDDLEVYTHRSGRTGRAGKKGTSLAIIHMKEKNKIKQIEKSVKQKITETTIPHGKDICEQQLMHLIDRITTIKVDKDKIYSYMSMIEKKLANFDREEILKRLVALEFNRFLNYYKDTPDILPVKEMLPVKKEKKEKEKEQNRSGFSYILINIGKDDLIRPPQLIGLINQSTRNRRIKLGQIDISSNKSKIEIENRYIDEVYSSLRGYKFSGKKLKVEKVQH
ncbi:MAG: DEAD/DEAH box helicase [Desulfobacterales bacterium]|nr:DEAD/DEAH box helicase [Desulfobacterales bacterium]